MEDSILQHILSLGAEMVSAVTHDDLDRYFALLEQRGTLIEELARYEHASDIDPNWQDAGAALQKQYQLLAAALAEQEGKMQEVLAGMQRYKGASQSYQRSEARPQILNENLRV